MEMQSAATSTDSRRSTGERRTFEMNLPGMASSAEKASVATVDSAFERELGYHRQIQPHGDLLRCKIPEFSRNLIFIIFILKGIVVFTLTFNIFTLTFN